MRRPGVPRRHSARSFGLRLLAAVTLAIPLLLVATGVSASDAGALLDDGILAYTTDDVDRAVSMFRQVIATPDVEPAVAARAWLYVGASQLLNDGDETGARNSFASGLRLSLDLEMNANEFNPAVTKVFKEEHDKAVAAEQRRKAAEEKRRIEEEKRRIEEEKRKAEEEKRKAEAEELRLRVPPAPKAGDVWTDPRTGIEFAYLPGGCFPMGCADGAPGCEPDEKPRHEVCVGPFWIGRHEVTQGQWEAEMGVNPSAFKAGSNPVEKVSWEDVQAFTLKVAAKGRRFRLPTEAEWEYAARAEPRPEGEERYAGGGDPASVAWYDLNAGKATNPVGKLRPNGFGLFDMSGNVGEWCSDWYRDSFYEESPRENPECRTPGAYRVTRGGSWSSDRQLLRVGNRSWTKPLVRLPYIGFRLVLEPAARGDAR